MVSQPSSDYPTVRVKPRADARSIRHGYPWVYQDDLVLDRRTKALPAGTLARLEDANRAPLATVAISPQNRIAVRVLDRDAACRIDDGWFNARVKAAFEHRRRLYSDPYYRLIHAEADGLPGVIVDRFGVGGIQYAVDFIILFTKQDIVMRYPELVRRCIL